MTKQPILICLENDETTLFILPFIKNDEMT